MDTFKIKKGVSIRQDEDDVFVIIYEENGYLTNNVGNTILNTCKLNPVTVSELCDLIAQEYEDCPATLEEDVLEILDEFVQIGLIDKTKVNTYETC